MYLPMIWDRCLTAHNTHEQTINNHHQQLKNTFKIFANLIKVLFNVMTSSHLAASAT